MPSQAGLFSAALTSFVVDSKQNLQANPTDKMVYYLEQHSTILSQISQQIASIAPQVSIPSTPPPPFPAFSPSLSDIRINAFWFMALTFSLSAALLAILVQQWVRDYMHVFQRYSDPQKSSRMRQYLYEGSEGWYLPVVAEAVPGLLHVSLFLFFVGLADSTLNINTAIGLSTTIPIGICGLLYFFITLVPVIYPQSPYQTSFSGVIWYAIQTLRGRSYKDRDGKMKSVSTNMAIGQMQLSTEGTMDREARDKRAILWLLDNLTEDAEIESFVTSMPGSLEAWTEVSIKHVEPSLSKSSSRLTTIRNVLGWVSHQPARQFKTICIIAGKIADIFSSIPNALRRIPDAICLIPYALLQIPHTLVFILYALYYNLYALFQALFYLIKIPMVFIGVYVQQFCSFIRRQFRASIARVFSTNAVLPRPAFHRPFAATSDHERDSIREFCWRIGLFLDRCRNTATSTSYEMRRMRARACVEVMASLVSFADVEVGYFGDTMQALEDSDIGSFSGTHKLSLAGKDQAFVARWTCLSIISIRSTLKNNSLRQEPMTGGLFWEFHYSGEFGDAKKIDETLEHRWGTDLEEGLSSKISFTADTTQKFHHIVNSITVEFDEVSRRTRQLPGVDFDFPDSETFLRQTFELFRDSAKLRFISCQQPLNNYFEYLKRVDSHRDNSPNSEDELKQFIENVFWPKHLLQRMLWSLDDIRNGGLGFAVELFLLSLRQLLSTYPSQKSYSPLYIGTFRAMTSDRRSYKYSLGTQKILLDVIASDQGFLRTFNYPDYITDEVWELLGDILEGPTSFFMQPHIDSAVQRLKDLLREEDGKYASRAEALISRLGGSSSL